VLKSSAAQIENPSGRLDSEFFARDALRIFNRICNRPNEKLGRIVDRIQHPTELVRQYSDTGLLIMLAKNIRENRIEFGDSAFMPECARDVLASNLIVEGDVLMTRSGANYGDSAPWKYPHKQAFACADLLVIRAPKVPSGYLSTFLSSRHGRILIDRGVYGMAQPHIAPSYLAEMRIPRLGDLESQIDMMTDVATKQRIEAEHILGDGEEILLRPALAMS